MSSESVRDRWLSIGMSVLLHGSLVALLAVGWWHFRQPAPAPTLPIDATVVDARTLKGMGTASTPAPKPKEAAQTPPQQPPAPPAEGPPPPTPDEVAMREQAAKAEAEHEARAQAQLLAHQQAKQAREEAARKAQAAADEQAAQAKAEEEEAKQAAAAKVAKQKKLAEAKKKAEAQKLAEQKKRQAEAEQQARVADLQQSLKEDERASAASGALASWQAQITARIQHAWIRPPTAQQGLDCVLNVTQVPGGSVTGVSIGNCNGDEAVRESIEAAVYRASPLPPPPDPSLFERELVIEFKPTN